MLVLLHAGHHDATTAATSTPAWLTALVAGLLALLGVVITMLFNYLRHRQEDRRRWEHDLMSASSDFLSATSQMAVMSSEHGEALTTLEGHPLDRQASTGLARIMILAPDDISDLAKSAHVASLVSMADDQMPDVPPEDTYPVLENQFLNALRKHLGITRKPV